MKHLAYATQNTIMGKQTQYIHMINNWPEVAGTQSAQ